MSKYRAVRTNGYASKGEARRAEQLKLMLRAGAISDLAEQVKYPLTVNGELIANYIADFEYTQDGRRVTEDFKGVRTRDYRLKRKLMKAIHGIEILETGSNAKRLRKNPSR